MFSALFVVVQLSFFVAADPPPPHATTVPWESKQTG